MHDFYIEYVIWNDGWNYIIHVDMNTYFFNVMEVPLQV